MKTRFLLFLCLIVCVAFMGSFFLPTAQTNDLNPAFSPQDQSIVNNLNADGQISLDELQVPLGSLNAFMPSYNTGYGVEWTVDALSDSTLYIGSNSQAPLDPPLAQLAVIGSASDQVTAQVVGLTRARAETLVGKPLSIYNMTDISKLSQANKGYYKNKEHDGLLILYFDTLDDTVLFALSIDANTAINTRYMTKLNIGPENTGDIEAMTLALINAVRIQRHLGPLNQSPDLAQVALAHSTQMGKGNFFSHTGSDGLGPKDRLKAAGITFKSYGEALAAGSWTPMDIVCAWMNSSGHRAILLGNYNYAGLGIFVGSGQYGIYSGLLTTLK